MQQRSDIGTVPSYRGRRQRPGTTETRLALNATRNERLEPAAAAPRGPRPAAPRRNSASAGAPPTAAALTRLQRTAGNHAVTGLLHPGATAAAPVGTPLQRDLLPSVSSTLSAGVNAVTGTVTAAVEAAQFTAEILTDPSALPRRLAEGVWTRMSVETKGLVINDVLKATKWLVQNGPLAAQAQTSTMNLLLQHGLLGFLDRALSYDTTFKIKVADRMMALLAHPTPEFALGFLGGFFEGLWDGVTGPFVLLWDIVKLQAKITEFQVRMAMMLADADKRKMLSADAAALIAKVEAVVGPALQEVLAGKSNPAALAAMFDRLLAPLVQGAEAVGGSVADAVVKFLQRPDRELGHGVGYVGGLATFEILLLVLTEGGYTALKEALSGVKWLAEAMEAAARLGSRAEAALAPLLAALSRFRRSLTAFPKLDGAASLIEELFTLLVKYFRLSYGLEGAGGAAAGRTGRTAEGGRAAGATERGAEDLAGAGERAGSRADELREAGQLAERKLINALGEEHEIHILIDGRITRCSPVCEAIATNLSRRADALPTTMPEAMQKEARLLVKQAEQQQRRSTEIAASGIPDRDRMRELDAIAEKSTVLEQKMSALEQRAGVSGVRPAPPFNRTAQDIEDLARDPANRFQIDAKSIHERDVGLDLESRGVLPGPIRRDTLPDRAEFLDINNVPWDIKGFTAASYDEKVAIAQIEAELGKNENVILDLSALTGPQQQTLRDAFKARPSWNGRVVFWP